MAIRAVSMTGRQRVIDQWSWQVTAERTVEQYRALLADARRDPDASAHPSPAR